MYTLNITVHLHYILRIYRCYIVYDVLHFIEITVYNVALDSHTQTITRIFFPQLLHDNKCVHIVIIAELFCRHVFG